MTRWRGSRGPFARDEVIKLSDRSRGRQVWGSSWSATLVVGVCVVVVGK